MKPRTYSLERGGLTKNSRKLLMLRLKGPETLRDGFVSTQLTFLNGRASFSITFGREEVGPLLKSHHVGYAGGWRGDGDKHIFLLLEAATSGVNRKSFDK